MKVFVVHVTSVCIEQVSHDATLSDFLLKQGDDCIEAMHVRDIFEEAGIGIIPSIFAGLHPRGMIEYDALSISTTRFTKHLGETDGIYLQLHGASGVRNLVCVSLEHYLLCAIRQIVGSYMPIALVMDPHGNVTSTLTERANIIRCYRELPHIDTVETEQIIAKKTR